MNHFTHDVVSNGLSGHLSAKELDVFNSEPIEPNSTLEPVSEQRLAASNKAGTVGVSREKVIEKPGSVKLISERRVRDEKLEWLKPMIADGKLSYEPDLDLTQDLYAGRCKIVDADGIVYDGILGEDGTVDEGWFVYDSADTFEYFSLGKDEYYSRPKDGPYEPSFVYLAETWVGNMHYFLRREKDTGKLFFHSFHRISYPSDYIAAVDTTARLESWLFNLHEQQTVIFPQTGHFVVSLPEEVLNQIERLARLEDRTTRDWIVERLRECTQDERSTAALAAQEARRKSEAALLEQLHNPTESG
jgi:hypothetical protein